jgi:hypothetical protein
MLKAGIQPFPALFDSREKKTDGLLSAEVNTLKGFDSSGGV